MQVIHGREIPDGSIEAAKEFISLAVSALATARTDAQRKINTTDNLSIDQLYVHRRDLIQECIDELSNVEWHVLALREISNGTR